MTLNIAALKDVPRLLMEANLGPAQGDRFQPTGFPDLGPAEYEAPDGTPMLLVESAQSMANRLEAVCWDEARDDLVESLSGLPYVKVRLGELGTTASLLEFHRLNSPYIVEAKLDGSGTFLEVLTREIGLKQARESKEKRAESRGKRPKNEATAEEGEKVEEAQDIPGVINFRKFAQVVFKYDPNSLVHGIFLEKVAGRLRLQRALSAFIEAKGVKPATSGGVKFDRVNPRGDAKTGKGHVPFSRTEFIAEQIKAYFSLDLAQNRSFGLPSEAEELLTVLSLWKTRRFLETGLRLRTACDLDVKDFQVTRPQGFQIPDAASLARLLPGLLQKCRAKKLFAEPVVTQLDCAG